MIKFISVFIVLIVVLSVSIDLFSLYLNLQRAKKGYGPSGIPGISFAVYIVIWGIAGIIDESKIMVIAMLLMSFHILCHFVLPLLYVKFLKMRK